MPDSRRCRASSTAPPAHDDATHAGQPLRLGSALQGVVELHRNDCQEVHRVGHVGQRVPRRAAHAQPHPGHQGAHHHHLGPDILQVHAQQSRVARPKPQMLTRADGTAHHPRLFHLHPFGRARGTGRLHPHRRGRGKPFRQKGIHGPERLVRLPGRQAFQQRSVGRTETAPGHLYLLTVNRGLPHTTNSLSVFRGASARCR